MQINDLASFQTEGVSTTVYDIYIRDEHAGEKELAAVLQHFSECQQITIDMPRLASIPPMIKHIGGLRTLRLVVESVREIPDLFSSTLTDFNFKSKELIRLPDELWSGNLERIVIGVDHLTDQQFQRPAVLGAKVHTVYLDIKNLVSLPSFLRDLPIGSLQIESDAIKEIDIAVLNPQTLSSLTVNASQFGNVPDLHLHSRLRYLQLRTRRPLDLVKWRLPSSLLDLYLQSVALQLPNLSQIPNVDRIQLSGVEGSIADDIGSCSLLRTFRCHASKLEDISSEIARCTRLESVTLSESVHSFPTSLLQVTSLESLQLTGNKIAHFNHDWSALINLKELTLSGNDALIDSFAFISDLPKLTTIYVNGNQLSSRYVWINKKKVPLPTSQSLFVDCKPGYKEMLTFAAALAKISCEESLKKEFFDHFWSTGELIKFSTADRSRLTHALHIAYTPLKASLHEYLVEFIHSKHGVTSLNEKSVLYVEGKTVEPITKVKEAIVSLGYRYSSALSDEVTHIIVGKSPSEPEAFNKNKFDYLFESDVFALVEKSNPKFLVAQVEQGNTAMLGGVTDLLLSAEAVNVNIGLQMLQTGGVPDEILDLLLMLAKSNPDSSVRAEAKKILNLQAPPAWRPLLDDKQLFKNLNEEVKEQDIYNKLLSIEKDAGFDSAALLSMVLYRRYKKGLRFMLLTKKASEEQKKKMYELLMVGEELDFATGLGFKSWKGYDPTTITLYTHKLKFPFPADVLRWHRVTSVNFHNCKLTTIPKDLNAFTDLKKLDLSCNFLSAIPAHAEKMVMLEELDLSSNNFKEFPMSLTKLKKLRKVDLRFCRIEYSIVPLAVPEEFKTEMPACEVLV